MLTATMKIPYPQKTFTVWGGVYGGHYDQIVFFKQKPTHRATHGSHGDLRANGKYVDCHLEFRADNIFCDMELNNFMAWFPDLDLSPYLKTNGQPNDTSVPYDELFEVQLTVPYFDDNQPLGIGFHEDWR